MSVPGLFRPCARWVLRLGILLCVLAGANTSYADDVRTESLIINGDLCVGFDCVDGENFIGNSVRLKENNTRVRFYNTASADTLGKSWLLEANDSRNGGPSTFRFKAQSLTRNIAKISDGVDVGNECVVGETIILTEPPPAPAVIPEGDPVTRYVQKRFFVEDGALNFEYACEAVDWWTEETVLRLDVASEDVIALGRGSTSVTGAVSMGSAAEPRVVKNVARPAASTDMLTVAELSLLPDRKLALAGLRSEVAALKSRLTALENADADGDSVPNGIDAFPTDPAESADSDGDGIGDNADAFDSLVTRDFDQNAKLTTARQSPSSTCTVDSFSVGAADIRGAPGLAINQQAVFTLSGCAAGEAVQVTIDFGEAFPPGAVAFKIRGVIWSEISGARVEGQTVSYILRDNGPLDANPAEGVIEDPVSVASGNINSVPLPLWLLALLAVCIGGLGLRYLGAGRSSF